MKKTGNPIRVLHVIGSISVSNGISAMVMNYYNKLDYSRLIFDFMLNEDVEANVRSYIEGNGSRIYIMPELKAVNTLKYIKNLIEVYKTTDYRIIHGHVANSAVLYLGLARNDTKRIVHSHNTELADIWWKYLRNWILTRFIKLVANEYIACSEEAAVSLFGKSRKAYILNNAIDVQAFVYDEKKREEIRGYLGCSNKYVIGHVGRFCAQKNHSFLLDVFNEVYKRNLDSVLLLIGDGELFNNIKQKAETLGLSDAVLFLGTKDNVQDYMSAMDVFALPSLFEGLGIVGIEAQASGLRVVSSAKVPRIIDITETVDFLPFNIELWVQALLKKAELNRHAMNLKVLQSRFNIETQLDCLYKYYEGL